MGRTKAVERARRGVAERGHAPARPAEPRAEGIVRAARIERGLSQTELAKAVGLTRQALYAIESNIYLPNVTVALRLARLLGRRVEDLFSLEPAGATVDGQLLGGAVRTSAAARAKVWSVGDRTFVLPVARLGPDLAYSTPADGLIVGPAPGFGRARRVRVQLFEPTLAVDRQVVVAGCDPAINLVAERLRRPRDPASLLGWPMGSTAAIQALKRGEVHVAGLHVVDPRSGEPNLPFVRRHLPRQPVTLVTFASWEAGFIVRPGNPKRIRSAADLARHDVRLVNREEGAGARLLLDRLMQADGLAAKQVRGYADLVSSHLDVGRRVAEGQADVGIGVESIARLLGLGFVPLQTERFDLVIPSAFTSHPGVERLLDALVSGDVRAEIEALGGYSTQETGKVVEQGRKSPGPRR